MSTPAIATRIIPDACASSGITPEVITEKAELRVSDNSIVELRAQITAALEVFGPHATLGPFVRSLPALFADGASETDRKAAGLYLVTEADLLAGHRGRARVGWVAALPGEDGNPEAPAVLVTITTNSSIEKALTRSDGTRENAYQLLFTQSWWSIPHAHVARFIRDDRMSRLLSVFALINEAIGERPGAWYSWGDEIIDPSKDGWRGVIGAQTAAEDAARTKVKLLAGTVGRMRANCWPGDARDLPLGLVAPTVVTAGGLVETVVGEPVIDEKDATVATAMLRALARGASAPAVGVLAAVAGLRNGDGHLVLLKVAPLLTGEQEEQVRRDLMPTLREHERDAVLTALDQRQECSDLARTVAQRAAIEAVRRVAQHVEFYRTGSYPWVLKGSVAGRRDYSGRKPTFPFDDDAPVPPTLPEDQVVRIGAIPPSHAWHRRSAQWQRAARRDGFFDQVFQWPSPVDLDDDGWGGVEWSV